MKGTIALTLALGLTYSGWAGAGSLLEVNGSLLRWYTGAAGSKTIITYALLRGDYVLPDKQRALSPDNCASMRAFDDILSSTPAVTVMAARRELRAAFDAWEGAANISFLEVEDPRIANIVAGAQDFPVGRAFTNLSYRSGHSLMPLEKAIGASNTSGEGSGEMSGGAIAGIEQSYICLNPKVRWKTGFDGELDVYDIRYTFMHEIGHAIGLDHPGSSGAIMAFRYDEQVETLQPSDIAAAQRLYGPPLAK